MPWKQLLPWATLGLAEVLPGDPECWQGSSTYSQRELCCADPVSGFELGCWDENFFFERCCLNVSVGKQCVASMSFHGEELAVIDFFGWRTKRNGVYVEIGALDGYTFSNTVTLRTCLGWSGMLIEGSPRNFGSLEKTLKVLRTPVVAQFGAVCPPPQSNTSFLIGKHSSAVDGDAKYLSNTVRRYHKHYHRIRVPCKPMSWYLRSLPQGHVDFLSLDVEGAELEVLLTMNFNEVVVEVFMIELHDTTEPEQAENWRIRNLLQNLGYKECFKIFVPDSGIFVRQQGPYANC